MRLKLAEEQEELRKLQEEKELRRQLMLAQLKEQAEESERVTSFYLFNNCLEISAGSNVTETSRPESSKATERVR